MTERQILKILSIVLILLGCVNCSRLAESGALAPSGTQLGSSINVTPVVQNAMSCSLMGNGASNVTLQIGQNINYSVTNFQQGMTIHWNGFTLIHGQRIDDLVDYRTSVQSALDTQLQPIHSGNSYYRYAILTDSSGKTLCDTRGSGSLPQYAVLNVLPSPVSCSLTVNGIPNVAPLKVGQQATYLVTTNAVGVTYHWFGLEVATAQASMVAPTYDLLNFVAAAPFTADASYFNHMIGGIEAGFTYTRYVVLSDANGNLVCDTRTANVANAPLTIPISL